jgi:hypothetical protein
MFELCSPHSRQQISKAVLLTDKGAWSGHRKGIDMRIWRSAQPTLQNERICYTFNFRRAEFSGTALTVSDALEKIGRHIERLRLNGGQEPASLMQGFKVAYYDFTRKLVGFGRIDGYTDKRVRVILTEGPDGKPLQNQVQVYTKEGNLRIKT